ASFSAFEFDEDDGPEGARDDDKDGAEPEPFRPYTLSPTPYPHARAPRRRSLPHRPAAARARPTARDDPARHAVPAADGEPRGEGGGGEAGAGGPAAGKADRVRPGGGAVRRPPPD